MLINEENNVKGIKLPLLICLSKDWNIISLYLLMKINDDSDFSPNSVDDNIKIVDPRQQIKKRKALLKIKDVSTKHSGLWSN